MKKTIIQRMVGGMMGVVMGVGGVLGGMSGAAGSVAGGAFGVLSGVAVTVVGAEVAMARPDDKYPDAQAQQQNQQQTQTQPQQTGKKCGEGQIETATFGCVDDDKKGGPVFMLLNIILNVLTFGIGALATVGLVMAGIQYATARDDAGQVAKAKKRIFDIVIGMILYALLYVGLSWLIPGGIGG